MFFAVSFWGLSVGRIVLVVPTRGSSPDNEVTGLDEKEKNP